MEVNIFWAIGSAICATLITYLTTYTNAKAKFQAELETIAKRTEEQEKVIAKYKIQDHQYQKRYDVYLKYLSLLDKFEAETPLLQKEETGVWMSQLVNALYLYREDEANSMKAINQYGDMFDGMVSKAMEGLKDIAVQTNEIKLVATNEINSIFEKLRLNYQKVAEISNSIFADPIAICSGKVDFDAVNNKLQKLKDETVEDRKNLISLMRKDLHSE
ncbi:hypothetical protein [Fluviicola chungangensis]|uniref:Uncharacterized protein n=1 Tax=Fluviicola chungangensis TaxID=2597671 RepID=A0A556MPL5_9FLAO|nr:hypothetical protein [Fluviicola chungangensis]TSJ41659.1 hypothetical protein FO442_14470 [Fluviicola chungangensis]